MSHVNYYDEDSGAWYVLRGSEHAVDLGSSSPNIQLKSAQDVSLHIGPISSLNQGGRWTVEFEIQTSTAPLVMNGSQAVAMPTPPPGAGFRVLVLTVRGATTEVFRSPDVVVVETSDDLRIELLVEGDKYQIAPPSQRPESADSSPSPATANGAIVLFDDNLDLHYGYFDLTSSDTEPGDLTAARAGQRNGLCGTQVATCASFVTGLHTGLVPIRIEWSPAEVQLDPSWEDVVEASVEFPSTDLAITSFEDGGTVELPEAGWHRVRYCVSGMDAGRELDTTDDHDVAPDRYLVQLWPASKQHDDVISVGSETAAYWHAIARGESK